MTEIGRASVTAMAGWSSRAWAPRDSVRCNAAATTARARSRRLRSSALADASPWVGWLGEPDAHRASVRDASVSPDAFRTSPACRHMRSCRARRLNGGAADVVPSKAVAVDSGLPLVWQRPGIRYAGASDEHGALEVEGGARPKLGERMRLVPGHCDPTVDRYDWYVGVRGGRVECLWPISARGGMA